VPSPPPVGDLKTSPSRSDAKALDNMHPTMHRRPRPLLLLLRGQTTWRWRSVELIRRIRRRASILEVKKGPPCRPKIRSAAASLLATIACQGKLQRALLHLELKWRKGKDPPPRSKTSPPSHNSPSPPRPARREAAGHLAAPIWPSSSPPRLARRASSSQQHREGT
jgi:hypothetical protein